MKAIGVVLGVVLWAGCGGGGDSAPPDATSNLIDAAPPDCNVVFLNFESQALTLGVEDSSLNQSSIINAPVTVPAYLVNDVDRDAKMAEIATQVSGTLGLLDVVVVTDRPATGDYTMVMMGGSSTDSGLASGIGGISAFAGCNQPIPKRITFAFDTIVGTAQPAFASANIAMGSYLVGLGTPTSSDPTDCLCWDSPTCNQPGACTLGDAATPRYDQSICGSGTTFDEPAILAALLTCP